MARTLGQLLSDRSATDAEIIEAVKAATKTEREAQWRVWYPITTRDNVYADLVAQAARNIRLLGGKK